MNHDGGWERFALVIRDILMGLHHKGRIRQPALWKGLNDAEIVRVIEANGASLPTAYETFLRLVGKCRNDNLFRGSNVFWPDVLDFKAEVEDLDVHAPPPMEEESTIILMHQGYIVFWCPPGSSDPPVYAWPNYDDDDSESRKLAASFSEWLLKFGDEW